MSVRSSSWCCCSCCRPSVDQRLDLGIAGARREQRLHALVDVGAVALHVGQRRPRDEAALRARVLRADALVVAVEEDAKGRIERHEAGLEALEQEGLEEPRDVREVPLGRARVGHRLDLAVLGRERRGERQAGVAHRAHSAARAAARGCARGRGFGQVFMRISSARVALCGARSGRVARSRRRRVGGRRGKPRAGDRARADALRRAPDAAL